jgi:HEAT repeat protein
MRKKKIYFWVALLALSFILILNFSQRLIDNSVYAASKEEVDEAIEKLKDKNTRFRFLRARELGEYGDKRAVPVLIECLSPHEDPSVRWASAYALGELKDERAIKPLMPCLKDRNNDLLRKWAAWSLGELNAQSAGDGLIKLLFDPVEDVKYYAVVSLGKLKYKQAAEYVIGLIDDSSWEIRREVCYALGKIGEATVSGRNVGREIQRRIEDFRENDKVRIAAARALGDLKYQPSVRLLCERMLDNNEPDELRKECTRSLGEIGDPRAEESLIKALGDDYDKVRGYATASLYMIGATRSIDVLKDRLKIEKNERVRKTIEYVLRKLESKPEKK